MKSKKIIICIVILIAVGLIAGGAVFALKNFSPEAKTAKLIEEGEEYYSEKEYDDAIDSFLAALEITPDSVEAYKDLVKVYKKLDDTDALLDILEEAYDATGDKYFKKQLKKLREELADADEPEEPDDPGEIIADLPDDPVTAPNIGKDATLDEVGEITLTMWCPVNEWDINSDSYEMAIEELSERYPNVILNCEGYEIESYKTKIKAAAAAGELPDIFFTWSGSFLGDFADAGLVYPLDDIYEEYSHDLPETMLGNSTYYGTHYGVPLTMDVILMYANMDILREVGYDEIPVSFNDLVQCCEALKEAGITPFGIAGKDNWCVAEYLEPIMVQTIGADTLNDIFFGRESWNNEGIIHSVDMFQGWMDFGYIDPDGDKCNYNDVIEYFFNGRYAFLISGSWNCEYFDNVASFEVGVGCFPVIYSEYAIEETYIGGPVDTLSVSASTPFPIATSQYCFELGELICHYGYLDSVGLPSWKQNGDTSGINPLTAAAADMCLGANAFVPSCDTAIDEDYLEKYYCYIEMAFDHTVDGQGFAEGLAEEIY